MKKITYLIIISALVYACTSPKENNLKEIHALEAKDSVFTPQQVESLKKAYLGFAEKYPDDELAPEYLFKAGQRCNVMAQHQESLQIFQRIIEKYPKSHVSEEALFLQGYIYENHLQDLPKAKKTYEDFINTYPGSDLVEDARTAIKNLGKSPEEIFESFNQPDSAIN